MKILEGTFRKDRAPRNKTTGEAKDIPAPPPGAKPPSWLGVVAKAEWKRIGPWLESQGLLTQADEPAFAIYCDLYATVQEFRRACAKVEIAVSIAQGYRNVLTKATTQMKQYLSLFGLSPADRERIGIEPQQVPTTPTPAGPNPEDAIFGRKRRGA